VHEAANGGQQLVVEPLHTSKVVMRRDVGEHEGGDALLDEDGSSTVLSLIDAGVAASFHAEELAQHR